jgi:NADH:ubiquinone reductase (non-electrogenic)
MGFSTFFVDRASRAFPRQSFFPHLVLVLSAVSSGGLVAYADAKQENAAEPPEKKKLVVLGTGWAGTSFLKNIDTSLYDVKVISPRNYFTFTPLLPSVTCGTVEARSIVEPIRKIVKRKNNPVKFLEAECFKIDSVGKKVHCRSDVGTSLNGTGEFEVDYDYLVIAVGATVNTFNTPGVNENCHFLKEIQDALRIRRSVTKCFERASLPCLNEEEKRKHLHFVIVGGGPTGVEFAAELHDFVTEDISELYPHLSDLVSISVVQSAEHILTMFDKRITSFAEEKFQRDGIEVRTGYRVVKVSDKDVTMKSHSMEEVSVPYGMIVWSTGIASRPVIRDFMNEIGQGKRRVLETNEWLRVPQCDTVYAIGDCATISQRKIMEDLAEIFKVADKDNSGTLTLEEIQDVIEDMYVRYPQLELYMKSKHMSDFHDLIKDEKDDFELSIEDFKKALAEVDSQVKSLPATAQVAAQQGEYLAQCLNKMKERHEHPEGPLRMTKSGHHFFRPFRYKHLGQFAPLGGEQAAAELPGDWVSFGHSTQWLWYSVYASKQVSWRTRYLVLSDWTRRFIFGRDSSGI